MEVFPGLLDSQMTPPSGMNLPLPIIFGDLSGTPSPPQEHMHQGKKTLGGGQGPQEWLQSGCRVGAEWLQSGCRVAAEWLQSGCRVVATKIQGMEQSIDPPP